MFVCLFVECEHECEMGGKEDWDWVFVSSEKSLSYRFLLIVKEILAGSVTAVPFLLASAFGASQCVVRVGALFTHCCFVPAGISYLMLHCLLKI